MNPTPSEAAAMAPLDLHTVMFRRNWDGRLTLDTYWRRIHRYYARQAVSELRYLTNRPRKGHAPTEYGQCA